jgi:hypothetical protein
MQMQIGVIQYWRYRFLVYLLAVEGEWGPWGCVGAANVMSGKQHNPGLHVGWLNMEKFV